MKKYIYHQDGWDKVFPIIWKGEQIKEGSIVEVIVKKVDPCSHLIAIQDNHGNQMAVRKQSIVKGQIIKNLKGEKI